MMQKTKIIFDTRSPLCSFDHHSKKIILLLKNKILRNIHTIIIARSLVKLLFVVIIIVVIVRISVSVSACRSAAKESSGTSLCHKEQNADQKECQNWIKVYNIRRKKKTLLFVFEIMLDLILALFLNINSTIVVSWKLTESIMISRKV